MLKFCSLVRVGRNLWVSRSARKNVDTFRGWGRVPIDVYFFSFVVEFVLLPSPLVSEVFK